VATRKNPGTKGDAYESVRVGEKQWTRSFLKLKFHQLNRIAIGPDRPRKEWLTEFLKQCESTAEKLALERALANQLPQALKQR
jgi:hypothetical protein